METTALVGIGGAGSNSIQNLYAFLSPDLHYRLIVASNKPDSLELSLASDELLLTHPEYPNNGKPVNDPRIGQLLAEHSLSKMMELLDDVQNVAFIAGLGGGTGSGVLPVFAKAAIEKGKKVLCMCILPFRFEGNHRNEIAQNTVKELKNYGYPVHTFDNQSLFTICDEQDTFASGFKKADKLIYEMLKEHFAQSLPPSAIAC